MNNKPTDCAGQAPAKAISGIFDLRRTTPDPARSCTACTEAKVNAWSGAYRADCLECSARALSHSPTHFAAAQAGAITPAYRDALQAVFGDDWKAGHERAKAWASRRKA